MAIPQFLSNFIIDEPFWSLIIFLFIIHWINHWLGKLFSLPFKKRSDTPQTTKDKSKTVEKGSLDTSFNNSKPFSKTLPESSPTQLNINGGKNDI